MARINLGGMEFEAKRFTTLILDDWFISKGRVLRTGMEAYVIWEDERVEVYYKKLFRIRLWNRLRKLLLLKPIPSTQTPYSVTISNCLLKNDKTGPVLLLEGISDSTVVNCTMELENA